MREVGEQVAGLSLPQFTLSARQVVSAAGLDEVIWALPAFSFIDVSCCFLRFCFIYFCSDLYDFFLILTSGFVCFVLSSVALSVRLRCLRLIS